LITVVIAHNFFRRDEAIEEEKEEFIGIFKPDIFKTLGPPR
jgi:hypothetical protein